VKILVTGATGFVGAHLVRRLIAEGHQVRCLARAASRTAGLEALGAEVVRGDVTEASSVAASAASCEAAFHLAALLGKWGVKESDLRRVNVEGTRHVVAACRAAGVRRFVHVSTPGVVGIRGLALATETDTPQPTGPYERTKWEAEQAVVAANRDGRMEVVIVRPDFVYGPGDVRRVELYGRIRRGRFRLLGDGSARVRPTYVDDVIDGMMLALAVPAAAGQVLNIAGPRLMSFREFMAGVARSLGVEPPRAGVPICLARAAALVTAPVGVLLRRPPLVTRSRIRFLTVDHGTSIQKAQRVLGYAPRVNLDDGLARTVAWYREQGLLP